MDMLVSIIVPSYNAESFLVQVLDSIRNQVYTNWEAICINDGSRDNTEQILKHYTELDNRFKFFTQKNQGVSAARNLALKFCNGEYICFVDSDDTIDPYHLKHLMDMSYNYASSDLWMCSFTRNMNQHLINKEFNINTITKNDFVNQTIFNHNFNPQLWCMLFKKDIITTHRLTFTNGCTRGEDREFYMKYILHIQNITYSNAATYHYRVNSQSAMSSMTINSLTSIDAAERLIAYYKDAQSDLTSTMQIHKDYVIWKLCIVASLEKNKKLFHTLINTYDVKKSMSRLFTYPRLSVKISSFMYYISANFFYTLFCLIGKYK